MRGVAHANLTAPIADDRVFHLAVHEPAFTQVSMADPPAGGVRVMANTFSEVASKASRAQTVYNAGQWALPCLKAFETSETLGPSKEYDDQIISYLTTLDSGGTKRGDAFEVSNEPSTNAEIDQVLRAIAGCSHRLRNAKRRVIVPHILGPGAAQVISRLNTPVAATGNCTWQMIDGFAFHTYGDSVTGRLDGLTSLRSSLNSAGYPNMPIFLTECGWPMDRLGYVDCVSANPGTGWPQAGYTAVNQAAKINSLWDYLSGTTSYSSNGFSANMTALKLRCWAYFAYADYSPTNTTNGYNHCGLVEQITGSYDGRAKGGASVVVDNVGPYGNALAAIRALPDSVQL